MLLFSGLSFAGFIALRLIGPGRGHGVAGLLGGLISSTAVTLGFARESREQAQLGRALALAVSLGRGVFRRLAGVGLAALAIAGLGMLLL